MAATNVHIFFAHITTVVSISWCSMLRDGRLFVDHNIHRVFISFAFIQILETHFPRYFPVERRSRSALVSLIAFCSRSTDSFS